MFGSSLSLFFIASFILALAPGPDLLYIMTKSSAYGAMAGFVSALGVHTGVFIHVIISSLGLSALIVSSPIAFSIVKYSGAIYLGYLGVKTLCPTSNQHHAEEIVEEPAKKHSFQKDYFQGVLTDALNPKVILFFLAFFPQFVNPSSESASLDIIYLGLLFITIALPINTLVGLVAALIGKHIKQHSGHTQLGKWMAGLAFILLGIGSAFTSPPPI